jgi:hypothetical protein
MAVLYKCDGCGALSPTNGQVFLHTHWTQVACTMQGRTGQDTLELLFCRRCLPVEEEVRLKETLLARIAGLRTRIGRWTTRILR